MWSTVYLGVLKFLNDDKTQDEYAYLTAKRQDHHSGNERFQTRPCTVEVSGFSRAVQDASKHRRSSFS